MINKIGKLDHFPSEDKREQGGLVLGFRSTSEILYAIGERRRVLSRTCFLDIVRASRKRTSAIKTEIYQLINFA